MCYAGQNEKCIVYPCLNFTIDGLVRNCAVKCWLNSFGSG